MAYTRARALWSRHRAELTHADWTNRSVDVYIHHTADSGPENGARATVSQEHAYLRRIEAFHVNTRGYTAIGYSYIIMPSGRCYEGRGFEKKGAHTLDPKDADKDGRLVENDDIGICFAGTFTDEPPTRRARSAYRLLRERLVVKGVHLDHTYPHRAAYATSCPGNAICRWLGI